METVWRSTDLVTWSQVGSGPAPADEGPSFQVLATSSDGIHLGVLETPSDVGPSRSTLKSSENGSDWHPVRTLPPDAYVVGVAPPTAPGRPWLVAIEREDPEEARILASRDLVSWTRVTFDKPGIRDLTATRDGWVAVGFYPSRDTGCYESCRPERPSLYTSDDGQTWVKRPASTPPAHTDILESPGDGRVLAAGWPTKDGVTLWRLEIEG